MKLKVCGLNDVQNIQEIHQLKVDLMGFIFYDASPRNVQLTDEMIDAIQSCLSKKVGVFVNESIQKMLKIAQELQLDYIQLHGEETPEKVEVLADHFKVIKAFSVDQHFNFQLEHYQKADLFLFDTKGLKRGGNGQIFDWNLLQNYTADTPFMLSGGIQLKHLSAIQELKYEKLIGIDVNSGFELAAGIKDIERVKELKTQLNEF